MKMDGLLQKSLCQVELKDAKFLGCQSKWVNQTERAL